MSKTSLGVRMITYRAKHRLSMREFAELMDEQLNTIYRIENGVHKPHKANEIRLTEKMDKLEAEERGRE
jgi:transcriptional regulator with XRE-family HTH domain